MNRIEIVGDQVIVEQDGFRTTLGIGTPKAFRILSDLWLRSGWDTKYVYSFSWFGRPIIQLPEDMIRMQELIFSVQPDVIVETGVAHGGSLVFYAGLCRAMDRGRVIGVDLEVRPHNREAIETHFLADRISLIEGDSADPDVVEQVRLHISADDTVMVLLDSCHTKDHVRAELEAYGPLVSPGSYIVAMDGIMEQVAGAPRTEPDWEWNNPRQAALEFTSAHADFEITEPKFPFNEGEINTRVSYWPDAYIQRIR